MTKTTEYGELLLKSQRDTNILLGSLLVIIAGKSGNQEIVNHAEKLAELTTVTSNQINEFLGLK